MAIRLSDCRLKCVTSVNLSVCSLFGVLCCWMFIAQSQCVLYSARNRNWRWYLNPSVCLCTSCCIKQLRLKILLLALVNLRRERRCPAKLLWVTKAVLVSLVNLSHIFYFFFRTLWKKCSNFCLHQLQWVSNLCCVKMDIQEQISECVCHDVTADVIHVCGTYMFDK